MKEKTSIWDKLLAVQKAIGAIRRDSTNPYFNSKYFDINSLLAEVKPILNDHGLILTQPLSSLEGKLAIRTMVTDVETGESVVDVCPVPETADAQKAGSAITYFRRYCLQSFLALEAEDDDANAAARPAVRRVASKPEKSYEYPTPKSQGINTDDVPF